MNNDEIESIARQRIIEEQYFPYENMTIEERDFCLRIISRCKDVSDSIYKINGSGKCEIIQMNFKKENDHFHVDGGMSVGKGNAYENRWLDADIFVGNDDIIVDMLIERLLAQDNNKYRVLDVFKVENNDLKRRSLYNHGDRSFLETIEDEKMKGMIK